MKEFGQMSPVEKKTLFEKVLTKTIDLQGLSGYASLDSDHLDEISILIVFGKCSQYEKQYCDIYAEYIEFCHNTGPIEHCLEETEEAEAILAKQPRRDNHGNNTHFANRLRAGSGMLALA